MADKYLIHGATYYGDGTTSAEATVDGGAGAWNNINILTGTTPTYGTLAAGDVVFIRSKSAAGADLTVTSSSATVVSIGKSGLTGTQGVYWVLDAGTIWSGISGTLTFQSLVGSANFSLLTRNVLHADVRGNVIFLGYAGATSGALIFTSGIFSELSNGKIDTTPNTSDGNRITLNNTTLRNPILKTKIRLSYFLTAYEYSINRLINPDIELTSAAETTEPIFNMGGNDAQLEIFGGRLYGDGVVTGISLFGAISTGVGGRLYGFQYPVEIPLCNIATAFDGASEGGTYSSIGADGLGGAEFAQYEGLTTSRRDGNFPTLNATLPDSGATPWAWLVAPTRASWGRPLNVDVYKLYSSAASALTLTIELLVSVDFGEINRATCVFEVQYIDDTTGLPVFVSSVDMAAGALDSSTATWSYTTYGLITFAKHKITVTTPSSVKQDTPIQGRLVVRATQVSATLDKLVVCPDIQVSAA